MLCSTIRLQREGWALIPAAIDAERLDALRAEVTAGLAGRHALRGAIRAIPALLPLLRSAIDPILHAVLGPAGKPVRGLIFDKVPGRNWAVPWHQDLTVTVRERIDTPGFGPWSRKDGADHAHAPPALLGRMLSLRIHLDDADADNGALRVIPGSQHRGVMTGSDLADPGDRARTAPCRAGDILLMRPLLAHASRPSTSPVHRRVIHLECAAEDLPGNLRWLEA